MAAAKRYWLVYYGQSRHDRPYWVEANAVIDIDPAAFLSSLLKDHPDHQSRVTFAVEIPAASYRRLAKEL